MAKRKTARKVKAKVKVTLENQFTCPFCNKNKSIECKLDKEQQIGMLKCRGCGITWENAINSLSEPMSGLVYLFLCFGNVKDACEEQKERKKTGRQRRSASPEVRKRPQVETEVEDDRNQNRYEADGLSDEEEDDGEKDYDPRKKVYVSSDED